MEGDVFEVSLSIKKMKSEKAYRESQLTTIIAIICALLNSDGGKLNMEFEDDAIILGDAADGILRMIEQRLVDIFASCLFNTKVAIWQRNEVTKQLFFNGKVFAVIMHCGLQSLSSNSKPSHTHLTMGASREC